MCAVAGQDHSLIRNMVVEAVRRLRHTGGEFAGLELEISLAIVELARAGYTPHDAGDAEIDAAADKALATVLHNAAWWFSHHAGARSVGRDRDDVVLARSIGDNDAAISKRIVEAEEVFRSADESVPWAARRWWLNLCARYLASAWADHDARGEHDFQDLARASAEIAQALAQPPPRERGRPTARAHHHAVEIVFLTLQRQHPDWSPAEVRERIALAMQNAETKAPGAGHEDPAYDRRVAFAIRRSRARRGADPAPAVSDDDLLAPAEAARVSGVSVAALASRRRRGRAPAPVRIGRRVYYRASDMHALGAASTTR